MVMELCAFVVCNAEMFRAVEAIEEFPLNVITQSVFNFDTLLYSLLRSTFYLGAL